jgi:hypothetical protein
VSFGCVEFRRTASSNFSLVIFHFFEICVTTSSFAYVQVLARVVANSQLRGEDDLFELPERVSGVRVEHGKQADELEAGLHGEML